MSDEPETKRAFWSSLPGILTGVGGIIVATTGLITALYSAGVIGPSSDSNSIPKNAPTALVSSPPSPSPTPNPDYDKYQAITGKWRIVEEPPQDDYFGKARSVTWDYDASVTGNVLTLTGKISFINGVNDPPVNREKSVNATLDATLTALTGEGSYSFTPMLDGPDIVSDVKLRFKDNLREFDADLVSESNGKTYKLRGRKVK